MDAATKSIAAPLPVWSTQATRDVCPLADVVRRQSAEPYQFAYEALVSSYLPLSASPWSQVDALRAVGTLETLRQPWTFRPNFYGPTSSYPRWLPEVRKRLLEILAGAGDFEGLQRPDWSTIVAAWHVACTTFPTAAFPPSVLPNAHGEVEFLWRRRGWDVQIAVSAGAVDFWARDRSSGTAPRAAQIELSACNSPTEPGVTAIREVLETLSA